MTGPDLDWSVVLLMDDPRLGVLEVGVGARERVGIVTFPYDEGCTRNGGRPGARMGPGAFAAVMWRAHPLTCAVSVQRAEKFLGFLPRMGCVTNREYDIDLSGMTYSVSRVPGELSLEDAHHALEQSVLDARRRGAIPWVVGTGALYCLVLLLLRLSASPTPAVAPLQVAETTRATRTRGVCFATLWTTAAACPSSTSTPTLTCGR